MTEGIYNFLLKNAPSVSLALLMQEDVTLDEKCKVLVAINWVKAGSPTELEPRLIAALGEDWEYYMNPFLAKLTDAKLEDLVRVVPTEYNALKDEKFYPMMKSILDIKLEDLEKKIAPHGITTSRTLDIDTSTRKLMSYKVFSKSSEREILRVELEAVGYTYIPRIYLFETGVDKSVDLTEDSLTNLKGLMYHMSDDDGWDVMMIDQSLRLVDFEPEILNALMKAIKSKYDKTHQ